MTELGFKAPLTLCSFIHIFHKWLSNVCHVPCIVQSRELGKCHLCPNQQSLQSPSSNLNHFQGKQDLTLIFSQLHEKPRYSKVIVRKNCPSLGHMQERLLNVLSVECWTLSSGHFGDQLFTQNDIFDSLYIDGYCTPLQRFLLCCGKLIARQMILAHGEKVETTDFCPAEKIIPNIILYYLIY